MTPDPTFPVTRFAQSGICILRRALDGAALADLRQRAQGLRTWAEEGQVSGLRRVRAGGYPDSSVAPDRGNTWGVNEITRADCFDPTLIDVLAHGAIGDTAESLVEQPRPWGLKLLWAPRHHPYHLAWHRDVSWHFDGAMAHKPPAQDHLQYNVALDDDSAFMVVPGSHRRPLRAHELALLEADRHSPLPEAQRISLAAGDVLIMDAHALHGGQADAGAPRLTLHYSVQAQWVPLWPWGDAEHFDWICSPEFRNALSPRCASWYQRLLSAQRCAHQYDWLDQHARSQGWPGNSPLTECLQPTGKRVPYSTD